MTKSKYRSPKTKPAAKEPHRGGGAWQDALDRAHISLFQAEYERKCPHRKGKEVVRACAKGYLDKFEGKLRSQFNVKNDYPEAQEIKDTAAWKAYVVDRTEVCSSQFRVSFLFDSVSSYFRKLRTRSDTTCRMEKGTVGGSVEVRYILWFGRCLY
jgi:hypothetical protein